MMDNHTTSLSLSVLLKEFIVYLGMFIVSNILFESVYSYDNKDEEISFNICKVLKNGLL